MLVGDGILQPLVHVSITEAIVRGSRAFDDNRNPRPCTLRDVTRTIRYREYCAAEIFGIPKPPLQTDRSVGVVVTIVSFGPGRSTQRDDRERDVEGLLADGSHADALTHLGRPGPHLDGQQQPDEYFFDDD